MSKSRIPAVHIAAIAILTAVTTVFTLLIRIPIAPTRGYINLGDVAVYFTGLIFGPFTAFLTAGLGTALADILGGYASWAPITFFAHGLQGLFIGWIVSKLRKEEQPFPLIGLIAAFLGGTAIMAGIYFITGAIMYGAGAAAAEIVGNIIQNLMGIFAGTLMAVAVRKAYPPVFAYRW